MLPFQYSQSDFPLIRPSNTKRAVVFDSLKLIYVEVGRAASSSIKYMLSDHVGIPREQSNKWSAGDMPLVDLADPKYGEYLKFTFIRNPWDRIASTYNWKILREHTHEPNNYYKVEMKKHTGSSDATFENFLHYMHMQLDAPIGTDCHWASQYLSVLGADFEPIVDCVGYFESFDEDFRSITSAVGIDQGDIFHAYSQSRKTPYSSYYTGETREYITTRFAYDIELFGYSYDKPNQPPQTRNDAQQGVNIS